MDKNVKKSTLDYTNVLTDSHNESSKALDTVDVSSLVPYRYGKIDVDYVQSGYGTGKVKVARYYSNAAYQETNIVCREDLIGAAHKTTISLANRNAPSLAGKGFILYDSLGAVLVWFNVDFANEMPISTKAYRDIEVNILSSHSSEAIAQRLSQKISLDTSFISSYNSVFLVVSSSAVGEKPNSEDYDSDLIIKNIEGKDSNTLNNKYFILNSANNTNQYYIWYNVDSAGQDPSISGRTGLEVTISRGSTADQVAQATKITLDSTGDFLTNIDRNALLIINNLVGVSNDAKDETSEFTFFTLKKGENRELLATLVFEYNSSNKISSIERL